MPADPDIRKKMLDILAELRVGFRIFRPNWRKRLRIIRHSRRRAQRRCPWRY